MARRCELTGKAVQSGNNVSHANNKTPRRFLAQSQPGDADQRRARAAGAAADQRQCASLGRASRRTGQVSAGFARQPAFAPTPGASSGRSKSAVAGRAGLPDAFRASARARSLRCRGRRERTFGRPKRNKAARSAAGGCRCCRRRSRRSSRRPRWCGPPGLPCCRSGSGNRPRPEPRRRRLRRATRSASAIRRMRMPKPKGKRRPRSSTSRSPSGRKTASVTS